MAGDRSALKSLSDHPGAIEATVTHRAASILANMADRAGFEGRSVSAWKDSRDRTALVYLRLQRSLESVSEVLSEKGVVWTPIKGLAVIPQFYDQPEERPTSDLDILVSVADFERARQALLKVGWSPLEVGDSAEDALRVQGTHWRAQDSAGVSLELHYRFWAGVPERWAASMLDEHATSERRNDGGLLLSPATSFVLGATHLWLTYPPRPVVYWWDLHRIAQARETLLVDEVVHQSRRWELEAYVGLSSAIANALWPNEVCEEIAQRLGEFFRWPERRADAVIARVGPVMASKRVLPAARGLARRTARRRWSSAVPELWLHPWTVEQITPAGLPWWRRRLMTLGPWRFLRWKRRLADDAHREGDRGP